jgi:hypothetical protein
MSSNRWIFKLDKKDLVDIEAHENMLGGKPEIKAYKHGFIISVEFYQPMPDDEVIEYAE